MTHPQANPTKVTDFQNIERITTSVLPTSTSMNESNHHKSGKDAINNGSNNVQNGKNSPSMSKKSKTTTTCTCNEIKTLLKIKVTGNLDDLTITCNGVKTADSIADLVNGYCRIVQNTELSFWDRNALSTSATNSLEKKVEHQSSIEQTTINATPITASLTINPIQSTEFARCESIGQTAITAGASIVAKTATAAAAASIDMNMPILSEDYVDIGLGEEEDNDYSTPAARNYELDRTQIVLNEIIGVGQFGDVHIGTCLINKMQKPMSNSSNDDSSQADSDSASANGEEKNVIHVAVKTCKADADLVTSEKFLEEACKCYDCNVRNLICVVLIFF